MHTWHIIFGGGMHQQLSIFSCYSENFIFATALFAQIGVCCDRRKSWG